MQTKKCERPTKKNGVDSRIAASWGVAPDGERITFRFRPQRVFYEGTTRDRHGLGLLAAEPSPEGEGGYSRASRDDPGMDRTLLGILTAFAVALLTVGLTFSRTVDAPADFRFVNETELQTLDPHVMTGHPEARIAEAVFEGLTRYDAKTHHPAPGVAASWVVAPDGKRITFHLRPNAYWTNGRRVIAADFVYSWKRLLDPALGSEYAYIIFPVRYAEALSTYDGHATALRTTIAPRALALAHDHANGMDAPSWQRFLAANDVNDALSPALGNDADLRDLLARRAGTVTGAELRRFAAAIGPAADRLRKSAAEARAHFGVDAGVFAPDDDTFVVDLKAPTPYFLDITSFNPTFPVPKELTEDPRHHDDWFLPENIISNGPYRLKRWLVNDHIRLERNELYWGKSEVHNRTVDAFPIENETTSLNLYLAGEVDWLPAQHYPSDLVDELRQRPDFYRHAGLIVYFYRFNTTRPPFNDKRVREALNLAVDRQVIVDDVLRLGQIPASTIVPPGLAGYEPPVSSIHLDVQKARSLLAEAGFPGGKGFPDSGILYNTNEAHKKIAEVVADQLNRNLGIKVNAYNQEWQSFLATCRNLDFDIARGSWVGDYPDPNTFLDMWVTNGGNNDTGFSSASYDRLIRAAADVGSFLDAPESVLADLDDAGPVREAMVRVAQASNGPDRLRALAALRMRLFREAESILVNDEFPVMPIYFYVLGGLANPNLRGFYPMLQFEDGTTAPNLQDIHPLRDIWVDRSGGAPR